MKYIILISLFWVSLLSQAQTYSPNREKFVKEFQKALSDYGKGDFMDFVKDELSPMLLQTTNFPDKYFTQMITTCNLLESKRLDPYPEVYNYVFSVYSFVNSKQPEPSYVAWHNAVDKLLESKNPKKFTDFAEMSAGFFSERRLTDKSNYAWFYEGGTYEFLYTDKPFIKLSNGNLICRVVNKDARSDKDQKYLDSLKVYKTSGEYDPVLKKWEGKGGTMNWEKVELDPQKTFAVVGSYQLSMKTSNLSIDSVSLTAPYFAQPIIGQITDRAFKVNREEDKIFPQFLSYKKALVIKNIRPNLDYQGGFALKGATFVGAGTAANPSKVILSKGGKPFIEAAAADIFLTKDRVYGLNTRIKIILNTGDSITHPGLNFTYYTDKKLVEFTRPSSGTGQAPFQDSYHQIDYYCPLLIWEENSNTIQLTFQPGITQEQRNARFESRDYFDEKLYDQLAGLATNHPLLAIYNYSYKYDKITMTEGDCATALGGTVEQVKPFMLQLSNYGFISYDLDAKTVTVNRKLDNFVKSKAGKKDFDNINFMCDFRPKKLNGYSDEQIKNDEYLQSMQKLYDDQTKERGKLIEFGNLNLTTLDINLNAVDRVVLSDVQNSFVYPKNGNVVVKKNRNFDFQGWFNAGKAEINTISANYNYAENKVNLVETQETILRVRPLKPEHGTSGIAMANSITGIVGEVLIDSPTNRSGNSKDKEFVKYPSLNSKKPSKVFYNFKDLHRGAYDSLRFYYTVAPFVLDTLDAFDDRSFRLKGELTSSGIFPVIKEDLKIMPDYSFGFSIVSPVGGYDFYGTGAKYENKILLSNSGLQGAGTINFVHSSSVSKDLFTFLPDSTLGVVKFDNKPMEAGVQFPDVTSEEAYMVFLPKQKILKATSLPKYDFNFFDKENAKLRGTATVTPNGMKGDGLMTFAKGSALVSSKQFTYKRWEIDSDTSNFNLKNQSQEEGENPLAFETKNVNSHISFKDRKGEFKSNKGVSVVEFPLNQYMCKMDLFIWLMDKDEIEMSKESNSDLSIDTGLDLVGPNFFSTHPKQDSLRFRAPKARFSLKEKTIYCSKVEYLDIADARIYPDSMNITIRKKAKMDRLENAKIVANYITKYHTFTKASVDITARRAYSGFGEYPYYDRDSLATFFKMTSISLDTSYQTIGIGKIEANEGFKLSPEFDYYGAVKIKAAAPGITFDGATRINHNCEKFERSWLAFSSEVDPKNIQIPVSKEMKNLEGQPISAGIVWRDAGAVDSIALYPAFLSTLVNPNDPVVITASGFLTYNIGSKEFQISTKEKLINRNEKGNYISLHTQSCSMAGDGEVNLGMDFGDVKVKTIGVVNYNQETGQTNMNLTALIDMPMDAGLFKDVAAKINATEGLNPMDFNTTTLEQAVLNWTDRETADKFKEDFTIKGEIKKLPKVMESGIVVSGLRLSYYNNNPNIKGLRTNVESAVLVNLYDRPVAKYVPLKAFFQQKYSGALGGDRFGLLIDIPGLSDYFFNYEMAKKDGVMDVVTSDADLSGAIGGMKADKLKSKDFSYKLGANSLKSVFLNLFTD